MALQNMMSNICYYKKQMHDLKDITSECHVTRYVACE